MSKIQDLENALLPRRPRKAGRLSVLCTLIMVCGVPLQQGNEVSEFRIDERVTDEELHNAFYYWGRQYGKHAELIDKVHAKTSVPKYVLGAIVQEGVSSNMGRQITYSPSRVVYTTEPKVGLGHDALADDEQALFRAAQCYQNIESQVGEEKALMVFFSDGRLRVERGRVVENLESSRYALRPELRHNNAALVALRLKHEYGSNADVLNVGRGVDE